MSHAFMVKLASACLFQGELRPDEILDLVALPAWEAVAHVNV